MAFRPVLSILIALVVPGLLAGQEKKPDEAQMKGKLFEGTVAGRKVSLMIPEGWTESDPAATPKSMPDAVPSKLAKTWINKEFEELTLRLLGVEKAGITATKVRDLWFEHAKTLGSPGIVVKADIADPKDKTLTGHDLEADFKNDEGKVYNWVRTLNVGKDKVVVLFVEARPLKPRENSPFPHETFVREPHVLGVQPILASFLKKNAKPAEGWVRGPKFEMSRGSASLNFDAPKGWEYTRLGPEGSVIWMAPDGSDREYIVAIEDVPGANVEAKLQIERMLVERTGGTVFQDRDLEGPTGGHEIISASKLGDRTLWNWRRVFQRGGLGISILAKVPVTEVSVPPPDKIQNEAKSFFDGVRLRN